MSANKFLRNYQLTIYPAQQIALPGGVTSSDQNMTTGQNAADQAATQTIIFGTPPGQQVNPISMEFDITHNIMTSANVCQIKLYNLSQIHRNQIRFNIMDGASIYRQIILQAGYGNGPYPVVFKGNINQAWSVREGPDFITTIECFDGGFALNNGLADNLPQFPGPNSGGTTHVNMFTKMMSGFPTLMLGAIGNFPGSIPSGQTFSGPLSDVISGETDGGTGNTFYIHHERTFLLHDNECIAGSLVLINADTGLLNTPIRELTRISFPMIFEPRLILGQQIQLQSVTDPTLNGLYKINSLKHRGMISPVTSGDAITEVGLFYSPNSNALSVVPYLGGGGFS